MIIFIILLGSYYISSSKEFIKSYWEPYIVDYIDPEWADDDNSGWGDVSEELLAEEQRNKLHGERYIGDAFKYIITCGSCKKGLNL